VGFDFRNPALRVAELVALDTPDGTSRFMLGGDGVFTDVDGHVWLGSALASVTELQSAIQGAAPSGQITLSYFQDPGDANVIDQVKALGLDYVKGRDIRFYIQCFDNEAQLCAPIYPPTLWLTRVMTEVSFSASGPRDRSISVGFETQGQYRNAARRLQFTPEGHAALVGSENPSLSLRPTTDFQPVPLFG
jgi:hypothetical protein